MLFLTFLLIEIESDGIQSKLRAAAGFGFIIGIVYILAMDVMEEMKQKIVKEVDEKGEAIIWIAVQIL